MPLEHVKYYLIKIIIQNRRKQLLILKPKLFNFLTKSHWGLSKPNNFIFKTIRKKRFIELCLKRLMSSFQSPIVFGSSPIWFLKRVMCWLVRAEKIFCPELIWAVDYKDGLYLFFFFKKTNSSRDTGDPHPVAASAVARHSRLSSSPFLPTHVADALTPPPRLPLHRDYGLKVFFFCSTNESGRRKLDLAIPQPNLARRRPDPACDN